MNLEVLANVNRHPEVAEWHVYPLYGRPHEASSRCWCEPRIDYKDPETGALIWVHNSEH